jgi:DNA-binding response OmpR family regulator
MVSPLNIILIEDYDALREVTADVLGQEGHHVSALACAEDIGVCVSGLSVDIFILDFNLPGEDAISLAKRIREFYPNVGIVMVTVRESSSQMAEGYRNGVDIYLVKPLAPATLTAAIDSLARRLVGTPETPNLTFSLSRLLLNGPMGSVSLQLVESQVLISFNLARERRLESWQLAEILGSVNEPASKTVIEVRITRLRKKLSQCGAPKNAIKSLRTIGYQLCEKICAVK